MRRVPPHKVGFIPNRYKGCRGELCTDVAMFETSRIFSRDSSYYYIGRFEVSSDVLRGVLTVTCYAGPFSS